MVPRSQPRRSLLPPPRRSKTVLLGFLSAAVAFCLLIALLGIAEVGLRLARREPPQAPPPPAMGRSLSCAHDSILGWIFPAGARGDFPSGAYSTRVEANRWGLRSPEVNPADTTAVRGGLERLVSDCERHRVELLMVLVPRRVEVTSDGWKARVARLVSARAKRMHREVAAQHHLHWIDLTPTLLAVEKAGSAYLDSDTHWNAAGHRAVAEAILDSLPAAWLRRPATAAAGP